MADLLSSGITSRIELRVTTNHKVSLVRPCLAIERTLISCGILALLISIWQYWWSIRYLWGEPYTHIAGVTKEGKQTPVIAVAIVLIGIGLFAFFAVLLRLT